jgi:chromosome segregation ATPase
MTLEQTLKTLKSAFSSKSAEAESIAKELSAVSAKNETLVAEAADLREQVDAFAGIKAERDAFAAKIAQLEKSLAASESVKAEATKQIESAGKVAAKIAAQVGVVPVEVSPAAVEASVKSDSERWDEYCAIADAGKKLAYYNEHRPAIIRHLGIK